MENLKEFLDSLIRATRDRFLNPLYVAFIVSWLIFNYEVVLVILGTENAAEKIRFIHEVLFPRERDVIIEGVARPLVAALGYVLLSPYIYRSVVKYAREREKETVRQLLVVAEETPLSPEAAEKLRLSARIASAKAKLEREKLETEIEDLNSRLSSVMDENDRLRKALSSTPTKDATGLGKPDDNSTTEASLDNNDLAEKFAQTDPLEEHKPSAPKELAELSDDPAKDEQQNSPVVRSLELTPRAVRFSPDDFPGYGPKERQYLVERGLSKTELDFLYAIRNVPTLTVTRLVETKKFDFNDAKTILDLFERMSLLEQRRVREKNIPVTGYVLTGIARMAIMAAKSRGILPPSKS